MGSIIQGLLIKFVDSPGGMTAHMKSRDCPQLYYCYLPCNIKIHLESHHVVMPIQCVLVVHRLLQVIFIVSYVRKHIMEVTEHRSSLSSSSPKVL